MNDDNTIDLRKFNKNLADPNEMLKTITQLEEKIKVMRSVLWEWNCSSGPVWEYYRLKSVGENESDYEFINDDPDSTDEYNPPDAKWDVEF
jgi:hypothetical protein